METSRCDAPRASPGTPGALKGGSGVKDGGWEGPRLHKRGFASAEDGEGPARSRSERMRAEGILALRGGFPPCLWLGASKGRGSQGGNRSVPPLQSESCDASQRRTGYAVLQTDAMHLSVDLKRA